jgi:hypothetical protein
MLLTHARWKAGLIAIGRDLFVLSGEKHLQSSRGCRLARGQLRFAVMTAARENRATWDRALPKRPAVIKRHGLDDSENNKEKLEEEKKEVQSADESSSGSASCESGSEDFDFLDQF